jgi:hypothetical protein
MHPGAARRNSSIEQRRGKRIELIPSSPANLSSFLPFYGRPRIINGNAFHWNERWVSVFTATTATSDLGR